MTYDLNDHYRQLLNLTKPWVITGIDLDIADGQVDIYLEYPNKNTLSCSECGVATPIYDRREQRIWRHLDTMQFKTFLHCRIPRGSCPAHGIKSMTVPWATGSSGFTMLFERFAIDVILGTKTLKQAGQLLRVSWDQISTIMERAVTRGMIRRKEENLTITYVGIDEKNFRKGHSYVTILGDISNGRVMDVAENRTIEATKTVLNEGLAHVDTSKIQAVAMDMWEPFRTAVNDVLPQADIVHDRFHVSGYLNSAVDSVRKKEHKTLLGEGNKLLTSSKYLWLKDTGNHTKDEKIKFKELKNHTTRVGKAWIIKEAFRRFWSYWYMKPAKTFFDRWYYWATHSRIPDIIKIAKMLRKHFKGIINYTKHHISNGFLESVNSRIQSIKAQARGFRSFVRYRIAILFHLGKLNLYP